MTEIFSAEVVDEGYVDRFCRPKYIDTGEWKGLQITENAVLNGLLDG